MNMDDDNRCALLHVLEAALQAQAGSQDRKSLVNKVLCDPVLYPLLVQTSMDSCDRGQQLQAKNWLIWLEQQGCK